MFYGATLAEGGLLEDNLNCVSLIEPGVDVSLTLITNNFPLNLLFLTEPQKPNHDHQSMGGTGKFYQSIPN